MLSNEYKSSCDDRSQPQSNCFAAASGVPCAATAAAPNTAAEGSAVAADRALCGGVLARAVPGTTRPWSHQNMYSGDDALYEWQCDF